MDPQLRQAIVTVRKSFWLPVVGFIALLVAGVAFSWLHHREIPFDAAAWRVERALRPRMIRSLLAQQQIVGMSRGEVDRMLGEPDNRDSVGQGSYLYCVGSDGVIDDMWLTIDFQDDRAVAVRYVPD
ncbi:MAG: hypothetical protein U0795_13905 [Pirellulales bacterium]